MEALTMTQPKPGVPAGAAEMIDRHAKTVRALKGDLAEELIATKNWLDDLAQLQEIERNAGESDNDLRARLLHEIGRRQLITEVISNILDRSRHYFPKQRQ